MGSRAPHALVDTTPAKTIVVYRNGDQFYVGRKFVLSRRRVATFEALLEQLTEQVEVPFGVRRLFTPTRGRPVLELDSLQAGGKYVAAGRERFKKLDYINIVPRKPAKMRKLKEIKPVVHCGMSVPSRWQTFHRTSRQINVFTNGRLFIPPVKIIIPKFSLTEWNSVLAMVGEKVFPLGGVRKLFTMNGHLLDNSKDLQDNHFYVAAGLEAFKNFPYWKSLKVPSEVQQKYTDMEKHSRRKKKEDPKVKDTHKQDNVSPKAQDSVFYAKEGKKKPKAEPLIQSGADGDVFKAQTPNQETQGAPEVKEAPDVRVELPVDGTPAEIVKDAEETNRHTDFEGNREKEDENLYEDNERKGGAELGAGEAVSWVLGAVSWVVAVAPEFASASGLYLGTPRFRDSLRGLWEVFHPCTELQEIAVAPQWDSPAMCGPHRSDLEQNGTLGFGALSPQVLPPQSDRFRRACYRVAGG
ncbi:doublecortin domain-containing protein 2C [Bubalus kerabau]|uniref:doublecortin domain-containing protein 2C n=1 Tax=Bubalus carabanensis TaxID=3119969 RepID=UPI00244EA34A|nr:doublecortin domain-containing protein 2C [Bubalus carabanensis]